MGLFGGLTGGNVTRVKWSIHFVYHFFFSCPGKYLGGAPVFLGPSVINLMCIALITLFSFFCEHFFFPLFRFFFLLFHFILLSLLHFILPSPPFFTSLSLIPIGCF